MRPLTSSPCGDRQVELSYAPPPPTAVAVSHSQLSVQPCGFWLLVSQMISYMVADAEPCVSLKCRAAGWDR